MSWFSNTQKGIALGLIGFLRREDSSAVAESSVRNRVVETARQIDDQQLREGGPHFDQVAGTCDDYASRPVDPPNISWARFSGCQGMNRMKFDSGLQLGVGWS